MIMIVKMESETWVWIQDNAACISHGINTFRKGMNPIIPPIMGK